MKDIDKRLTHIMNEMNAVVNDLSNMLVDSIIHINNQENDIEDLKLQLQAADQEYQKAIADCNIISKKLIDVRKIIKDNTVVCFNEDGDKAYFMNIDSQIEGEIWESLLNLLGLTEEDIESYD